MANKQIIRLKKSTRGNSLSFLYDPGGYLARQGEVKQQVTITKEGTVVTPDQAKIALAIYAEQVEFVSEVLSVIDISKVKPDKVAKTIKSTSPKGAENNISNKTSKFTK